MRVKVDHDRCEGNAVCLGIAPDIFDLDDEDYAVVKTDPVPADQEARPSRRSPNAREQPWYAKTRGIHKLSSSTNATDLSGKVAVVTGAAAGLGRAEAIGLARAGATVVVNDIAAALDASDVIDEITTAGSKAVAVSRRHQPARHGRRIDQHRRRIGRPEHRGQQRRDHARPDVVQHVRRGVGRGDRRAPARPFPADPQRRHVLAVRRPKIPTARSTGASSTPRRRPGWSARSDRPTTAPRRRASSALTLTAARALGRYGVCANAIAPRARTAMTADVFGDAPRSPTARSTRSRPSTS